jgi:hypothetical protein
MLSACAKKKESDSITGLTIHDLIGILEDGKGSYDIVIFIEPGVYWGGDYVDGFEGCIYIEHVKEQGFSGLVTVKIDGNDMELEHVKYEYDDEHYEYFYADFPFLIGNTYNLSLTYAGRTHAFIIRVPDDAKLTSMNPIEFDPSKPFTLSWSKERNSDIQAITYDFREGAEGHIDIPSNTRTYTIPANTIKVNVDNVRWGGVYLNWLNYAISGRIICLSGTHEGSDVGWFSHDNRVRQRPNRMTLKSIIDLIESR